MPSLGWHDPIWKQLYGPASAPLQEQTPPHAQEPQVVDYLDQLQQAAAANVTLNLSDMPGYQTNLQTPN